MKRLAIYVLAAVLVIGVGAFAISHAFAQVAPGQGTGRAGMGMPMMMGGAVMVANSDYVYVIWMGNLYQFDAKTLKQTNSVALPRPQLPQAPTGFMPGPGTPGGGQ